MKTNYMVITRNGKYELSSLRDAENIHSKVSNSLLVQRLADKTYIVSGSRIEGHIKTFNNYYSLMDYVTTINAGL